MEIDLLALVGNREVYERFKPLVKEHVLGKEASLVFNSIGLFFKSWPDIKEINWGTFESYFFVLRNSQIPAAARPNYRNIFEKLKVHVSTMGSDILAKHFITLDYSTQLADVALKVGEGRATIADVSALIEKHDKELVVSTKAPDLFVTGDVASILARAAGTGLDWRLEELNVSCGPVRQGDFILVAAYVGTGKTTFAASEVTHMATQLKDTRPVIWVNNEEESNKVMLRIMQSALGVTLADIQADLPRATAEYEKIMGMHNRILVTHNDSTKCNVHSLTEMFEKHNPAIIVFDQLDKVAGFEREADGKEYDRLGRVYKWGREASHKYGPVFAISQTDGASGADQYIRMNQLRGSKVDKPGEADAIITIGKSSDPTKKYNRYIHVPKNKMFGGARSEEAHREGYWEVEIAPEIARYVGTR